MTDMISTTTGLSPFCLRYPKYLRKLCIYNYFNISPAITCFMQINMASELSTQLNWLYLNWLIEYIGNGVKQGGILSPLLFNIYMDDLSLQLHRQSIGCSVGGTVVNHMLYADDIVLFAPSAKGLQKLLDISHTYGCNYDIEYNPSKSSIMYIDSRKAGNARSMTIGGKILNVVTAFSYLGHIIIM